MTENQCSEPSEEVDLKEFLNKLLVQDDFFSKWSEMDFKDVVKYVELEKCSCEYTQVHNQFTSTLMKEVTKIERVQNPFLLAAYNLKKKETQERFTYNVDQRKLFHGSTESKINLICETNFDWRLVGSSLGHRFGRGVSFSPKSSYSMHYCKDSPDVMLLAYVLQAKSTVGNEASQIPPDGYDTTHKTSGDVVVKYEDNEFYPAYKIYFRK